MSTSERDEIRAEVVRRGITRVVHFTQSRKLAHILSSPNGIQSSRSLQQKAGDVFNANDPNRYDNHPDHISCSIEYPNIWMLRKAREREKFFEDWSILAIKRSVLWKQGTLFSPRNAAASGGVLLQGGVAGLGAMYANSILGAGNITRRRTAKMLQCVSTDDQGEVMVSHAIPLADIIGVIVPSEERAAVEIARLEALQCTPTLRWIVAPDLFSANLSSLIRDGIRPKEYDYSPVRASLASPSGGRNG